MIDIPMSHTSMDWARFSEQDGGIFTGIFISVEISRYGGLKGKLNEIGSPHYPPPRREMANETLLERSRRRACVRVCIEHSAELFSWLKEQGLVHLSARDPNLE
jgi:hypothetical protein